MTSRVAALFVVGILAAMALGAVGLAACNPIPYPPRPTIDTTFRFDSEGSAVALIALLNLATNLFLMSSFLYLCCLWLGPGVGDLSNTPRRFLGTVVLAAVLVSAAGGFIDFYLLMDVSDYYSYRYDEAVYVLEFRPLAWMAADLLVFASVFLCLRYVVWTSSIVALGVATAIAVINLLFWSALDTFGEAVTFFALVASFICILPVLAGLFRWHAERFTVDRASSSGPGPAVPGS
ncbi:MAG: hypothetical protein A3K67_05060 [Euryarchaeota archaeon RBG_16_62_10]|nr:MAG: hypothetical protein A3K67_05060 [Euryarchaeota archaeon RBG_16_62_10]